jgi:hypothetical protein
MLLRLLPSLEYEVSQIILPPGEGASRDSGGSVEENHQGGEIYGERAW